MDSYCYDDEPDFLMELRGVEPLSQSNSSEIFIFLVKQTSMNILDDNSHCHYYCHIMASLRKKPNSKYYYACFMMPGGKQVQRSTKTTSKRVAQKLADQFEEAARERITEAQARKVILDIHRKVSGSNFDSVSTREFLDSWLLSKKGAISIATMEAYTAFSRSFCTFLKDQADEPILYLSKDTITKYRDSVCEALTPRTANNKLKILRTALQQAWRDGLIDDNPAARIPILKVSNAGSRRAFTIEELRILLSHTEDPWKGMVLVGLYTGQRLGDVARLRWKQIDFRSQILSLTTSKTGRRQILPIATPLFEWFEQERDATNPSEEDPVFVQAHRSVSRSGKANTLSRQFREVLARAGLVEKRDHKARPNGPGRKGKKAPAGLSFHCLRHTTTSMLKNAGISPAIVQEFVGHDSKEISENYTHIETDALRVATDAFPDLFEQSE